MTKNQQSVASILDRNRKRFLWFMAFLSIVVAIVYPIVVIVVIGETPKLEIDGLIILTALVSMAFLKHSKTAQIAYYPLSIMVVGISLAMVFTSADPVAHGYLYYLFLVPIVVAFLLNEKQAIAISMVHVALVLGINRSNWPVARLPEIALVQYAVCTVILFVILHYYRDAIEENEKLVKLRELNLDTTVKQLETEVGARKQVEDDLRTAVGKLTDKTKEIEEGRLSLERMNKTMVDRELAMIKLKDRIKELEAKNVV